MYFFFLHFQHVFFNINLYKWLLSTHITGLLSVNVPSSLMSDECSYDNSISPFIKSADKLAFILNEHLAYFDWWMTENPFSFRQDQSVAVTPHQSETDGCAYISLLNMQDQSVAVTPHQSGTDGCAYTVNPCL